MDLVDQVRKDIQTFKAENHISRAVMVWCASTEIYIEPSPVHESLEAFEKDGIILIYSAGWGTRCRSKSIFFVETAF